MARSFFITRAAANSEDPTALEFWPAKGSDELHEALKQAFPFETNLKARMRAAVIEFYLQEQQAEQFASISPEYLPSPQSSFVSTMPSPSTTSSQFQRDVSQPRRQSTSQSSQQAGMDVWQLPNKPQAKVHTRRTMTGEEKKAYKQKRLIGACTDCKRRRRKCDHNSSVAGTSPVAQKVGKHKKRTPTSKSEPILDFSWPDAAFTLDNDMSSLNIPVDPAMPSFELDDTIDFDFTPDLNNDWQLFPDLPRATAHADMPSTWSSDFATFDSSVFTPHAGLSHSRVSTSTTTLGVLSTGVFAPGIPGAGVLDAGVMRTGAIGNSPITPVSLSPMSRTQSANGLLDQYDYDNPHDGPQSYPSSSATLPIYSAGANIDQSRVSPGKSDHMAVTPVSLSPLSRSQSLNGLFGIPELDNQDRTTPVLALNIGGLISSIAASSSNATAPMATTSRRNQFQASATTSNGPQADATNANAVQHDIAGGSQNVSIHDQERLAYQDELSRDERCDQSMNVRSMANAEHYSSPSVPQQLLQQTEGMIDSASRMLISTAPQHIESSPSRPLPSTTAYFLLSTTSRPRLIHRVEQAAEDSAHHSSTLLQREHTLSSEAGSGTISSVPKKCRSLFAQVHHTVTVKSGFSVLEGTSPNDWSLAQARICVILYTAYCAFVLTQSSNGFALMTGLLVGAVMLFSLLHSDESSSKAQASMSSLASKALGSYSMMIVWATCTNMSPKKRSRVKGRPSSKSIPLKQ